MRIARSIRAGLAPAILTGGILLLTGCGGGAQTDGVTVGPTEEVQKSREAMQKQLQQNPNLYAPTKGAQRKGTQSRSR